MKKYLILVVLIFLCFPFYVSDFSYANDGIANQKIYIYDQQGNFLIEKSGVEEGDQFLDENFTEWEIVHVTNNIAIAKIKQQEDKPKIKIKSSAKSTALNRTICLYMTHNDESYVPSDGYDSIYGVGGIHDVAKDLKAQLERKGIKVYIDETLHIPHNSTAYSRSKVTATNLNNAYNPSGLFDIHRDGVAKSIYLSQNETSPLSKIRIVVGKGNSNFEKNYAFAKEVFSVGKALYPWLFLDVYCGKGTYNQNLQEHALLFEMGTYLIEKEYVLNSTPYLANVINTVLFKAQTDTNGDIIIDQNTIDELEEDYQNHNNLNENNENLPKNDEIMPKNNKNVWIFVILSLVGLIITTLAVYIFRKKSRS